MKIAVVKSIGIIAQFMLTSVVLSLCACGNTSFGGDGGIVDGNPDGGADSEKNNICIETSGDSDPARRCQNNGRCVQKCCGQVLIPTGIYPRGSDERAEGRTGGLFGGLNEYGDETPQHDAYLDAFCIDRYEVSLERYWACVDAGVCDDLVSRVLRHYPPDFRDQENTGFYPVIYTHWALAARYCEWIGRRLCTEAEWERAANGPGPEKRTYPWGEDEPVTGVHGNFCVTADDTEVVDLVSGNPDGASYEGVQNLSGNVYEWVADWYAPYPQPPEGESLENPRGPDSGIYKVGRGGCTFVPSNYTTTERTTFDPFFSGG